MHSVHVGTAAELAAALRSAYPGDVIELARGVYDGEVVVDKPVELRGQPGATLTAGTGNTLMLLADATIRDLTIIGNAWGAAAVEVSGAAPRIIGCEVRAPGHIGIRVRGGARPIVEETRIGPALHGLCVESAGGTYDHCVFTDTTLESVIAALGADPLLTDCGFEQQGGHAVVAVDRATSITLRYNDIEAGPVAAVRASGGRITVLDTTVHGGAGAALEVDDDGTLRADRVRVENAGAEGVLVGGGQALITSCRFTGTHGPAVWMTDGRARFEGCEAIDSDQDGFLVVGGEAEFVRCVAHNNAGQGFALLQQVTITRCSSFGNGRPDGVGQQAVELSSGARGTLRTVGVSGYRTVQAALDAAADGDVIELEPGEYVETLGIDKAVEVRPSGKPGSAKLISTEGEVLGLGAGVTLRDLIVSGTLIAPDNALVALEGCELIGGPFYTGTGGGLTFRDCQVRMPVTASGALSMTGCTVTGARGVTVMYEECVVEIRDCRFEDVGDTAVSINNGRVTMTNVTVLRSRSGVGVYDGSLDASGLTVTGTERHGIEVHGGINTFSECVITGSGAHGVAVYGGMNSFEQCRSVGGKANGFEIFRSTTTLTRCTATDNLDRDFFFYDSAGVTIAE